MLILYRKQVLYMPDYEKLFYESQAELADLEERLKQMVLEIQSFMRSAEEKVISDDDEKI